MKPSHINWMICLYLPLAAGITVCLALLMQMVVSTEFAARETESDTSQIESVNIPYVCDCTEGTSKKPPLRELYQTLPSPARLEPDKTCETRAAKISRYILIQEIWTSDPERAASRAASLERLNIERVEKYKQDKCPLILKS